MTEIMFISELKFCITETMNKPQNVEDLNYSKKQMNSLGIPKNEFKDFMRQWKLKNH